MRVCAGPAFLAEHDGFARPVRFRAASAAVLATPVVASANGIIVLDFEGIGNGVPVGDHYNGAGPANRNYGINFSPATLALVDADAGGTGNFANEPSPHMIRFLLDANDANLNFATGLTTCFSFFYSSAVAVSVNVYERLNATGNLLASLSVVAQYHVNCTGDPTGAYCNWTPVGVLFAGLAGATGPGPRRPRSLAPPPLSP